MTAKEIYESIDLSQLPKESAEKLRKVEKATEGFTIESDKVNNFMNSVYKKIKENKPTALKNLKVEEKVTKTEVKKGDTTQVVEDLEYKVKGKKKVTKKTPTPSKPTKKSTFLGEVKKRKKKGEDWEVAKARVKKELDEERAKAKADAEKVVSKTSQALKNLEKMLKDDPKLAGYPRTYGKQSKKIDAAKDAKIKAKPAGKRVSKKGHKNQYGESKGGRVYWENRDNRSDRYAPDFPNKVFLEVGGELDDLGFPMGHTYLVVEVSPSGDKKLIKKTTDYITALTSSAVARGMKSSKDARVVIVDMEEKRVIHEAFEAGGEITITPTQLVNNPDALVGTTTMTELFEYGGVTAYQEGGEVFVTQYPLTNAGSGDYVAGSNTMSNMFAKGGQVSLGMKKDLEFFEDIRVKTLNMENKQGILLQYGFVEPEDAKKYEKESGYKFKEDKSIAGVIDVKNNKAFSQGIEDGDKYFFFFNTTQPDRVVIIDAFDGDKLSATRADNKRAYLSLKLFLLDLRLETSGKMAKGGEVLEDIIVSTKKFGVEDIFERWGLDYNFEGTNDEGADEYIVYEVSQDHINKIKSWPVQWRYAYAKGGFVAFYNGKRAEIDADTLLEAKKKAIQELKVPKSKQGLLSVMANQAMENEDFRFMAKGGYVAVGEKDGFWTIVSTPTTKEKAKELLDMTTLPKGEKGKVVSVDEAMSHKNVLGKEYLESGGTIVAADPSAAMEDLNQTYGYESVYEKGGNVSANEATKPSIKMVNKFEPKEGIQIMAAKTLDGKTHFGGMVQRGDLARIIPFVPNQSKSDVQKRALEIYDELGKDEFFEKGGRLGFEGLAKKVAKRYEGKPVKAKYQKEYGKTYSKEEAMEVGRKVAAKVYGQQQANMKKMAEGGSVQGHLDKADRHLREAGTKLWENKNPKEAKFTKAYNQFDEKVDDLFTRRELSQLGYAKGGSINFKERTIRDFKKGEIVYDTLNKRYGIVIWKAEPIKYNSDLYELRLDSDGMQPTENLRKLGEAGDVGTKKQLFDAVSSYERLRQEYPSMNYPEIINNPFFAKGGSLMGHGLEVGDKIVKDLGNALKVSTKDGNIVYVDLASGYREKDMPLPFAKGGAVSGMTIPEIAKKFDRTTADVFSQLQVGEAHEMEHTSDPKVARKIALDHLAEDLDYYTKLKKLGL